MNNILSECIVLYIILNKFSFAKQFLSPSYTLTLPNVIWLIGPANCMANFQGDRFYGAIYKAHMMKKICFSFHV